jgi:predicted O-methyltransferase YrrM
MLSRVARRIYGLLSGRGTDPEQSYFDWCMANARTYFGPLLGATQGQPVRHAHMRETVRRLAHGAQRPLHFLEIGSWAGGSAITFGMALRAFAPPGSSLLCVDPWVPYAFTRGNAALQRTMTDALSSGAIFRLFEHNLRASGIEDLVMSLKAKSAEALPLLRPASFDLVFVDGDHRFDFVRMDLNLARCLVRPGGILCGDDLEKQFFEVDAGACHANRDEGFVPDPATGSSFHPGVTLAVHEVLGRVSERDGFWAAQRNALDSFIPFDLASPEIPQVPGHFSRHRDYPGR